jgi:hypothetical protein
MGSAIPLTALMRRLNAVLFAVMDPAGCLRSHH